MADSYIHQSATTAGAAAKSQNTLTCHFPVCFSLSLWKLWVQSMSQLFSLLRTWATKFQPFPMRCARAYFCFSGYQS